MECIELSVTILIRSVIANTRNVNTTKDKKQNTYIVKVESQSLPNFDS